MKSIKKLISIIFSKENIDPSGASAKFVGIYGNLFLAVISAILTGLNVYKKYWFMTGTTTVLILGFVAAAILAKKDKKVLSRFVTALMCAIIFSIYAITGQNDGFAILWILLVPLIGYMLVGLRAGFCISAYFQIFLIVLFYTPLKQIVADHYTATFQMRFPVLYFASFGAVTLLMCQRQTLYNQVHHQAYYDALTGLYNRHYYNEIHEKVENKVKYPDLNIISMDLNRLKYTNDNFGHAAGDEILVGTAELLRQSFPDDTVFRTGGDEFVVISERHNVVPQVEAFKRAMLAWRGKLVETLNVSVGTASRAENPEMNFEELSKLADKRMYEEKSRFYRESGLDRRGGRTRE